MRRVVIGLAVSLAVGCGKSEATPPLAVVRAVDAGASPPEPEPWFVGDWLHCETPDCTQVSSGVRFAADGQSYEIAHAETHSVSESYCISKQQASHPLAWSVRDGGIVQNDRSFALRPLDGQHAEFAIARFLPDIATFVRAPRERAVEGCSRHSPVGAEPWVAAPWQVQVFRKVLSAKWTRDMRPFPIGDWIPALPHSRGAATGEAIRVQDDGTWSHFVPTYELVYPADPQHVYCGGAGHERGHWHHVRGHHARLVPAEVERGGHRKILHRLSDSQAELIEGEQRQTYNRAPLPVAELCER